MFNFFRKKSDQLANIDNDQPSFGKRILNLFKGNKNISEDSLIKIEEILINADVGYDLTTFFIDKLRKELKGFDGDLESEMKNILFSEFSRILGDCECSIDIDPAAKPYVIMLCGVNGNGKTTVAGKLAHKFKNMKVGLVACDTFRAAAVEQLEVWSKITNARFFHGKDKADPSSIIYESIDIARKDNIDLLIIDTAGRLHNNNSLMDQLQKMKRVMKKFGDNIPHETLLVIDGNTGQNAVKQVLTFDDTIGLDSIIITKMDGTAKAGILLQIADKCKKKIRFIGVGESLEDLMSFNCQDFCFRILS